MNAETSADGLQSGIVDGEASVLDLDHLSRQTGGDRGLQREVLELFVRQVNVQVSELGSSSDLQKLRETAHGIVGSAKAVGAFDLARVAHRICSSEDIHRSDVADLTAVVDRTRVFIVAYLAR